MSRQFFKNGFSQSNHFFNIVIAFQVLWRIDFGRKSRISGRAPRRESFYSFAYFIFGGEGRTAMAASMAWQNSAKTYFKRNHDRSRQRLDVPDLFTLLIFMAIHPLFKNMIF